MFLLYSLCSAVPIYTGACLYGRFIQNQSIFLYVCHSVQTLPSLMYHHSIFFFHSSILQADTPDSQNITSNVSGDTSEALSQALHEKVCALVYSFYTFILRAMASRASFINIIHFFSTNKFIADKRFPGCIFKGSRVTTLQKTNIERDQI